MKQDRWPTLARPGLRVPLLVVAFFGLAVSRRWEQLISPQVWCEDWLVIRDFASIGWHTLLLPVNGYLIMMPKLITGISLEVSASQYPMISALLAFLFSAIVGLAVALSPTHLRGKLLCAAAIFLVPTDTEVFGAPLYTLWWAPVLLLLVALWEEGSGLLWLRLLMVAAGGLSSPLVLVVLPVLYVRALWSRKWRTEGVVAVAATAVGAVQAYFIATGAHMGMPPSASLATQVIPKFCGWFILGNVCPDMRVLWVLGILLIALAGAFLCRNRGSAWAWILVYLYCGAVASTVLRVDPAILHPGRAGPRYFFYAYLLTYWILIQLAFTSDRPWLRRCAAAVCALAVVNAVPVWTRHHDDLQWKAHLVSGRLFPEYSAPIQYDGTSSNPWWLTQSGAAWDALERHDLFLSRQALEAMPTFAYRVVPHDAAPESLDSALENAADGSGATRTLSVAVVNGRREGTLNLTSGRRIRYRCGPTAVSLPMRVVGYENVFIPHLPASADWVTLEFSNSGLPGHFTLQIEDTGQGIGEWAAVGHKGPSAAEPSSVRP